MYHNFHENYSERSFIARRTHRYLRLRGYVSSYFVLGFNSIDVQAGGTIDIA
jgi:hypothetical protein